MGGGQRAWGPACVCEGALCGRAPPPPPPAPPPPLYPLITCQPTAKLAVRVSRSRRACAGAAGRPRRRGRRPAWPLRAGGRSAAPLRLPCITCPLLSPAPVPILCLLPPSPLPHTSVSLHVCPLRTSPAAGLPQAVPPALNPNSIHADPRPTCRAAPWRICEYRCPPARAPPPPQKKKLTRLPPHLQVSRGVLLPLRVSERGEKRIKLKVRTLCSCCARAGPVLGPAVPALMPVLDWSVRRSGPSSRCACIP